MANRFIASASLAACLAACGTTPTSNTPPPPPAPSSTSGTTGATGPSGASSSCAQILDCATEQCAADDEMCQRACLAKGSAPAQKQVTDLLTCADEAACQDESCLQTQCKNELYACAGVTPEDTGGTTSDPYPQRFTGTVGETVDNGGGVANNISTSTGSATVVFERVDSHPYCPPAHFDGFYVVKQTYTAQTRDVVNASCSYDITETFSVTPNATEDFLCILKAREADGGYGFTLSLTAALPTSQRTTSCGNTFEWRPGLRVSDGAPNHPTSASLLELKEDDVANTTNAAQRWRWDLKGEW